MQQICLLGASGSIGLQTIDVMRKNPKDFPLVGFSIGKKIKKINVILKYFPSVKYICVQNKKDYDYLINKYPNINFYYGDEGLISLIDHCKPTMVVNALVGFVGLKPSLFTLENNLILALANKETLVVGGELINNLLDQGKGELYPIDSEHVALRKCLSVEDKKVKNLYLTASGGAFRNLSRNQLKNVKASDALKHPTWKMGKKITIDCATMVNKTFEIIEAYQLFHYPYSKLKIMLHDESYIHSYVEYADGTLRLDEGKPDMRIPIEYALYRGLVPFKTITTDRLTSLSKYHFHNFDIKRYPIVSLAKKVIKEQGLLGAIFNASNEVAVNAFLLDQIAFLDIEKIIHKCMKHFENIAHPTYEDILLIDRSTREYATSLINEVRL